MYRLYATEWVSVNIAAVAAAEAALKVTNTLHVRVIRGGVSQQPESIQFGLA